MGAPILARAATTVVSINPRQRDEADHSPQLFSSIHTLGPRAAIEDRRLEPAALPQAVGPRVAKLALDNGGGGGEHETVASSPTSAPMASILLPEFEP